MIKSNFLGSCSKISHSPSSQRHGRQLFADLCLHFEYTFFSGSISQNIIYKYFFNISKGNKSTFFV